jgi:NADH:ubiquinone oxidoreductase subunit 6 (subunit J)
LVDFLVLACASVAAAASLVVILRANVLHGALALIAVLLALAGVYAGLGAYFVAAVQVIVYAGAIMVLFLFAMMVLESRREKAPPSRLNLVAALVAAGGLLAGLVGAVTWYRFGAGPPEAGAPTVSQTARFLLGDYLLAFELVGLLLLVALVAVTALARRPGPGDAR